MGEGPYKYAGHTQTHRLQGVPVGSFWCLLGRRDLLCLQLTCFSVHMHILETAPVKPLRASSGLTECSGLLFRAEQVFIGMVGWYSVVEWTNQYFGISLAGQGFWLYSLFSTRDVEKFLNLESSSPFFQTQRNLL